MGYWRNTMGHLWMCYYHYLYYFIRISLNFTQFCMYSYNNASYLMQFSLDVITISYTFLLMLTLFLAHLS